MAGIELSVLARQCLFKRMASINIVRAQVQEWQENRNQAKATINWHFTTEDARIKLETALPIAQMTCNSRLSHPCAQ